MTGKLYGNAKNFRTQKVLIAAKLGKKDVQLAGEVAPAGKFPLGATPAFEDGNTLLFGAESIAIHLGGESVKGANCAEVIQWLQFAEGALLPNVLGYVLPSVSAAQLDNKVVAIYKAELLAQLGKLNEILASKTFLVGERLSIADISVALDLLPAFEYVLCPGSRKGLVNVTRWFQTVVNQPIVKDVLGDVKLAEKVAQFDEKKFKELSAKVAKAAPAPKAEKKEAVVSDESVNGLDSPTVETTNSSSSKKKNKKKKKAEKKPAPVDDAEEDVPAAPKAKDPFESMPKGTFNMDNFKRVYSNEDTATKAIPHFWENFDAENNSIWFGEYKYPEDLTLTFMSCNLINGMFQRLEKLKKNAFASVCLFGTDNNSTISGVWVWRGQDLAFELSDDWKVDFESYAWKKLDAKSEETKKIVNEYLMWEGDFGGKKFNQGKIFK